MALRNRVSRTSREWHEELSYQFSVMDHFETERRVLAVLPYAIAAVWLPLWLSLLLIVLSFVIEYVGFHTLRRVVANRSIHGYRLAILCYAASAVVYMVIPALTWQIDNGYAKSFAVGAMMVNLNHMATIRSVHMPLAMSNVLPSGLISLGANGWYWVQQGNWTGLMISTLALVALFYFVQMTILAGHQLHRDLARDRRAAEVANDAKSRFMAQMSHELRTPLNAILGLGIAELDQARAQDSKERLSTLVTSARGLSVLLDDILDLSAVEAGALPIRPTAIDPLAEIEATLSLYRQQILDAGQALDLQAAQLPKVVLLDGQRMRQCLSNVISNAVKYGGAGPLVLRVEMLHPGKLAIDLIDSGPGVPETLRSQIFEPFRRGDGQMPGTGLGLAISRRLARRMGGDLVLLPSDRGAHFRLTLTVSPAPMTALPQPRNPSLADLRGKRVLVVDDIATNRLVAVTYLRMMGATAMESDSGAAALARLATEKFDLILLDLLMPGMDGIATLQELRRLPFGGRDIPVIAMTADASEERRKFCLEAGMNGYVGKPISPEALSEALAPHLARQP